jgi:hypothetical protein
VQVRRVEQLHFDLVLQQVADRLPGIAGCLHPTP